MTEKDKDRPWWFPVVTDSDWCNQIRADYPEEEGDMDDDDIRDHYSDGWKYADTWDHLGDARAEYEKLADAYLELLARTTS